MVVNTAAQHAILSLQGVVGCALVLVGVTGTVLRGVQAVIALFQVYD
jgi:hypothetical protein